MNRRLAAFLLPVWAAALIGPGPVVMAQTDDRPADGQDVEQPALPQPDLEVHRPGRTSLLREGSFLVEAVGTLERHDGTGWWQYELARDEQPSRTDGLRLIMLPNALFEEMRKLVESMPDQTITFEATGEVFVYHGRNFFLITHAPELVSYEQTEPGDGEDEQDEADADDEAADAGEDEAPAAGADDPVEAVEERLEQAVGALARSPRIGRDDADSDADAGVDDGADLLPEGELSVQRQGSIVRDATGAWMFVFDSDASGLADPPLILLPCRLLEMIESQARQRGTPMAVLISGTVSTYGDRNYLLPTMYRFPQHHSELTP